MFRKRKCVCVNGEIVCVQRNCVCAYVIVCVHACIHTKERDRELDIERTVE